MTTRSTVSSAAIHAAVLLALLGIWRHAPKIAPYQLPGTSHGLTLLTYYSPGGPQTASNDLQTKKAVATEALARHTPVPAPATKTVTAPSAQAGTGSAAESGLGEGDIKIALQKYFPYPKPDLSVLPHGTKGDVILNAVIDANGNISQLTLLKGLDPAIDNLVIATVKQWSYTPALKDGVPVPSEQELHFHYERG
jgi:periplasmic protein TonB